MLSPLLVGRSEELRELRALVEAARGGLGGLVALVGEPGVGKSRLAREAQGLASGLGATCFTGRAAPSGGPFRALTNAFLSYGRRQCLPSAPELAPFGSALGAVVPDWRPTDQGRGPAVSTTLIGEGLIRLLRVTAPRGALLVLEDLHWADPETVEVLDYLADNLAEEPLACLVTLRNDEPYPLAEWLSTVCARRVARRIDVQRLTAEQSLELARACLDVDVLPHPLEMFLLDNAEGLPLLVRTCSPSW